MKTKTCIASINPTIGDWSGQLLLVRQIIDAARKADVRLLVLPELALGTPDARDLYFMPSTAQYAEQVLADIATQTKGMTVVCGMPLFHDGNLYNVAAVLHDGMTVAFVPKCLPACPCEEDRWFARWDFSKTELHLGARIGKFDRTTAEMENLDVFLGELSLCPEVERGAVLVHLCDHPFSPNQYRRALSEALDYSRHRGVTVIHSELLGCLDGTHIYDGGGYIVSRGGIETLAPRFVLDRPFVVTTSDDTPKKAFDPSLAHFKKSGSCPVTDDDYVFCEIELAIVLGLHDYMRRAGVEKLCLALSGGRDSAMIAILVSRLVALREPDLDEAGRRQKLRDLLVTAYLPSRASSSSGTQTAALALAQELGFECPVIPVADLAVNAVTSVEDVLGRAMTWEQDDLALQNVQSRARSLVIWTLANAHGAMLLTTGNMSEAAVGYATMDGDASGCLDPIGNLPKTLVSRWLAWARGFHGIEALDAVFAQPPSAELRPLDKKQSDEDDLMPYAVLDAYMDCFFVRHMSPREMWQYARTNLAEFYTSPDDIRRDIRRFIQLTTRSQWKRIRFANGFRILDFDLSEDLRWPCLQAPFVRACDEM